MRIEYDKEVDGAYVWIKEPAPSEVAGEVWPAELGGEIGMLFGDDGKLIGIEIMPASKYLPAEVIP